MRFDPQYFEMTTNQLDHYIAHFILNIKSLDTDVEGAPFRIGQKVRILQNPNNDNTFDTTFANKVGEVWCFEYECGCGQTFPDDPMIAVRLKDGKSDEFWKEELELVL